MKESTLSDIRMGMRKLLPVAEAFKKLNGESFPIIGALCVMIGNLAGNFTDCQGYSTEDNTNRILDSLKIFKAVAKYESDFYIAKYICEQADMIIDGAWMYEGMEEEN